MNKSTSRWSSLVPSDVLGLIWNQKLIILVSIFGCVGAGALGTWLTNPTFQAKSTVEVVPVLSAELKGKNIDPSIPSFNLYMNQQFYKTEVQKMSSRSTCELTIELMDEDGVEHDLTPSALRGMLRIAPRSNSRLIDIAVEGASQDDTVLFANYHADAYVARNIRTRQSSAETAKNWLKDRIEEYNTKIATTQNDLLSFRAENDLADVEDSLSTLSARMKELNRSYADLSTQVLLVETVRSERDALARTGAYQDLAKMLDDSSVIRSLLASYADARTEHTSISAKYGEKHPTYRQSANQLENILGEIKREVTREMRTERVQLQQLKAKEVTLEQQIERVKKALLAKQRVIANHDGLASQLQQEENFLATLIKRRDELQLAAQTQLNNATIMERAVRASRTGPNWTMNLGAMAVVGLALGGVLAIIREAFDETVRTGAELASTLDIPFLGYLPYVDTLQKNRQGALKTFENANSISAEAVRSIRTLIDMNPSGIEIRRLAVASSASAEGKTVTAIGLALAYARLGRRVVLIDADMRRSQLHHVFGCENVRGLSTVLSTSTEPKECLLPTPFKNLSLLPAGPHPENPNELLSSSAVPRLLAKLEQDFDLIVFDTPPTTPVADALALSRNVDGIILVARAHSYARRFVFNSVERLRQVDANILGLVVNAFKPNRGIGGYQYGHPYRYDYNAPYGPDGADNENSEADVA